MFKNENGKNRETKAQRRMYKNGTRKKSGDRTRRCNWRRKKRGIVKYRLTNEV